MQRYWWLWNELGTKILSLFRFFAISWKFLKHVCISHIPIRNNILHQYSCCKGNIKFIIFHKIFFSSVTQSCLTLVIPWIAARQASLSITNSRSLPKPMSIELVMPANHLILCYPLLLLPAILPSIKAFSSELISSHQVAKVSEHQSFQWIFRGDFL